MGSISVAWSAAAAISLRLIGWGGEHTKHNSIFIKTFHCLISFRSIVEVVEAGRNRQWILCSSFFVIQEAVLPHSAFTPLRPHIYIYKYMYIDLSVDDNIYIYIYIYIYSHPQTHLFCSIRTLQCG